MAGRNHISVNSSNLRPHSHGSPPSDNHRHRLPPPDLRLIEDQSREIQTLLRDNQRLAVTHVALKQEVATAEQDLRHLSAAAASVKAERDAQVRNVYERSLKLEAQARSLDGLPAELDRVRADVKELLANRNEMLEKLKDIEGHLTETRSELQQFPQLKTEIETMRKEIQRGRAAIDYERKMRAKNFELSEAMEKHIVSMTREAQKLHSQLAEKTAMGVANPAPGYTAPVTNYGPGYGGNLLSHPYAVNQGSVDAGPQYGLGAGFHVPPAPYEVQQHHVHS